MSERTIFKALSAVQGDIARKGISKGDTNTFDNYKYRGIDAVLNALAPIFAEHGLLLIPSQKSCEIRTIQTAKGTAMNHCKVEMEFTFYDKHGDSITHTFPGEAMDRGDKSINKACTAAYKYFLFEAFTIPVEGTPDADSETHEVGAPQDYTEQFDTLSDLMTKNDPMAVMAYMDSLDETARTEVFNYAPQGQKTAFKNHVRQQYQKAREIVKETVEALNSAMADHSYSLAEEILGELSVAERERVLKALDPVLARWIENMEREAA